jgi:uncharacterized protein YjbI with pentapeptide repeats
VCRFSGCSFLKADLRNARLNAAIFRSSQLSGARIAGANLFGAEFEECKLQGVDFSDHVTLTAAKFVRCNLDYARFRAVSLARMDFERCSFVEADLSLTNLFMLTSLDGHFAGPSREMVNPVVPGSGSPRCRHQRNNNGR